MNINLKKKIVVSNYNANLQWLKITHPYGFGPKNTVIYDKGDIIQDWSHMGEVIRHPNIGANQYDILTFIIDNYNNLPDYTIFLKGNIFSPKEGNLETNKEKVDEYYTTKERFIEGMKAKTYFSFWYQSHRYQFCPDSPKEMLDEGLMQQPVSYCDFSTNIDCQHKYFTNPHQILDWCFDNPPKEPMIKFLPSSNMVLPKKNILNYSKELYEKLKHIINYIPDSSFKCNIPAECYLIERIFYTIWSNKLIEK